MTASVRAPQRWQRISATAGISILPLILMFPSRALTPALGNLAAERVQLPGANVCKLTRFRSGEGPKWPLRPGRPAPARRLPQSRGTRRRPAGRAARAAIAPLGRCACPQESGRLSAELRQARGRILARVQVGLVFRSQFRGVAPDPEVEHSQPANRRRWASARTWTPTAATGSCGPAAGPTGRPGMRAPNIAWGRGFVRRRYGLIGWHPHARVMGDLPPEARREPAGPAPKGRQATARQPRPSRTQPWVPGLI
jgi:hypothetical protein